MIILPPGLTILTNARINVQISFLSMYFDIEFSDNTSNLLPTGCNAWFREGSIGPLAVKSVYLSFLANIPYLS